MNTDPTNLSAEAAVQQALVFCLDLNTNKANLTSEAPGRKVIVF